METTNPYESPDADLDNGAEQDYQPKLFSLKGRIGRVRYFSYLMIASVTVSILGGFLATMVAAVTSAGGLGMAISMLAIYIPLIASMIIYARRRLHDLNGSGWWSILTVIPPINLLLGLYLMFAPGTKGNNKYGLPPNKNGVALVVVMLVAIVSFVGILAAVALPAYQQYIERAGQVG